MRDKKQELVLMLQSIAEGIANGKIIVESYDVDQRQDLRPGMLDTITIDISYYTTS